MIRKQIPFDIQKAVMNDFRTAFYIELKKKGDGTFASRHEILGVLQEEFKELVDAVQSNDIKNLEEELLDIMVGTFWGLCSIKNNSLDW